MAPLLSFPIHKLILQPLYQELLPRIKINRYFLSVMVTAYPTVAGLGLGLIEYEQVVEVINLFISLYHSPTLLASLLNESLELMQVKVGINTPVLEADYRSFGFLVIKC